MVYLVGTPVFHVGRSLLAVRKHCLCVDNLQTSPPPLARQKVSPQTLFFYPANTHFLVLESYHYLEHTSNL